MVAAAAAIALGSAPGSSPAAGAKAEPAEGEMVEEGAMVGQGAFYGGSFGHAPPVGHHFGPPASRDDPFSPGYAAIPPPACLDASGGFYGKGKGYKGKGKGKGAFDPDYGQGPRLAPSDGLIMSGIPVELNTFPLLHRHFRQFGEVVKITSHPEEGKAFVQFADRAAAQVASTMPVFDRQDIVLSWAPKAIKGGRGKGSGPGKGEPGGPPERPVENRVLVADPEEQSRLAESKRRKDEVAVRKAQLLGAYTDQMKAIMSKLTDETMSEARREAMRTLLLQIKDKMDALGGLGVVEEPPRRPKGKGKSKGKAPPDDEGGYPGMAPAVSSTAPGLRAVKDDPKEEDDQDEKPLVEVAAPDEPADDAEPGDAAAEEGASAAAPGQAAAVAKADADAGAAPPVAGGDAAKGPAAAEAPAPPAAGPGDVSPKSEEDAAALPALAELPDGALGVAAPEAAAPTELEGEATSAADVAPPDGGG